MLKGISPLISPDLLKTLHEMGHGDEILLADAHFPGHALGRHVLRADGLSVTSMLHAVAPLLALDAIVMMETDRPEELDSAMEAEYVASIAAHASQPVPLSRLPRQQFYQRVAAGFCVLMTGETRPYGNILLRKGVTL